MLKKFKKFIYFSISRSTDVLLFHNFAFYDYLCGDFCVIYLYDIMLLIDYCYYYYYYFINT